MIIYMSLGSWFVRSRIRNPWSGQGHRALVRLPVFQELPARLDRIWKLIVYCINYQKLTINFQLSALTLFTLLSLGLSNMILVWIDLINLIHSLKYPPSNLLWQRSMTCWISMSLSSHSAELQRLIHKAIFSYSHIICQNMSGSVFGLLETWIWNSS